MSEEDFKAKYKNKNFKKVLEHFKAEKRRRRQRT